MTNIETKARAKHIAVVNSMDPRQIVPSQLKVFIAEGTAMNIVDTENAALSVRFMPLTNM